MVCDLEFKTTNAHKLSLEAFVFILFFKVLKVKKNVAQLNVILIGAVAI